MSPKKRLETAIEMLEKVGIPHPVRRIDAYPHELSGGCVKDYDRHALVCNPRILIADEPTTALDVTIQADLELLKQLQEESDGDSFHFA